MLPRYLVDVSKRDQSQTIFGHKFNSPFGISPTGSAGLFRRGADLMLAEAARDANVPYIMSGASNQTSMEAAAKVAPQNTWYQLYAARDGKISDDLIKRAADCGLEALVLTVDVPVRLEARAQHPQRLCQHPRQLAAGGAEAQAGLCSPRRWRHPGWIYEYITPWRHPEARQLAALSPRPDAGSRRGQVQPVAQVPRRTRRPGRSSNTYRKLFPRKPGGQRAS